MDQQFKLVNYKYFCLYIMMIVGLTNMAVAKANTSTNKSTNNSKQHAVNQNQSPTGQDTQVEQNFDKIRQFQSYDPATDLWSTIEEFKTVEILADTTQQRQENYIYYSFWAYNPDQRHWYKVNIRDYGYRYGRSNGSAYLEPSLEKEIAAKKKRDSLWKNLHFNISAGSGGTLYKINPHELQLFVRGHEYFLQTKADINKKEAYLINWFKGRYTKKSHITKQRVAYSKQAKTVVPIQEKFDFQGLAFNIPITTTLHFTCFQRLRLGLGSNFEIQYLRTLYLKKAASHIKPFVIKEPWLFNIKWFGLLGYKIVNNPKSAIILDTQLGKFYDTGSQLQLFWEDGKYLYTNWYVNVGIGYEKKLNNYLKLSSRLSGDYKNGNDQSYFAGNSTVVLHQTALHLDVGISFNFAKDTDGMDVEELDELLTPETGN